MSFRLSVFAVADPGFPEEGVSPKGGGGGDHQAIVRPKFPQNCTTKKKIWPKSVYAFGRNLFMYINNFLV